MQVCKSLRLNTNTVPGGAFRGFGVTQTIFGQEQNIDELAALVGIVHRIDKDTSGLLMIAKNDDAHLALAQELKDKKSLRKYWAIVHGNLPNDRGVIEAPIGRSEKDRKKQAVTAKGKPAVTRFQVLERFGDYTLLELQLETGRTHQIRVHMAYIGHPVAGDEVYGPRKTLKGHQIK